MCVEYLLIGTHFFGEENNNKQTNQPPPPPPQKERKKERKPLNNQTWKANLSLNAITAMQSL